MAARFLDKRYTLERIMRMHDTWTVTAALRITRGGRKGFGPGVAQLLDGVRQSGSIRSTAAAMGMSYNKAWHILRACEDELGFALLERRTGGAHGGGARLTEQGQALLEHYEAFAKEAHAALEALLDKHLGGELDGK